MRYSYENSKHNERENSVLIRSGKQVIGEKEADVIHFIKQLIRLGMARRGSALILGYMALLTASSLLIMLVEPPESGLSHFDQALWWSVVTSTTVGYGDLFPTSNPGRIVAVLLPMFMGIGLGAAFITHIASVLIEGRDRKMHGEKNYTGRNHVLVVGYTDETGQLIDEIHSDDTYSRKDIVLVADIERHPLPEREAVFFVKGRPDTLSTLKRAGIDGADCIVIHTGDDERSLFALINALTLKTETCDVTVRCISTQSIDTFSSVAGEFQVIMQMTAEMMVQAMQDKVHIPLQILLRNNADEEIYYILVPRSVQGLSWWALHLFFKDTYDYLTFAMQTAEKTVIINPEKSQPVSPGDGIWLIARQRPVNIAWPGVN